MTPAGLLSYEGLLENAMGILEQTLLQTRGKFFYKALERSFTSMVEGLQEGVRSESRILEAHRNGKTPFETISSSFVKIVRKESKFAEVMMRDYLQPLNPTLQPDMYPWHVRRCIIPTKGSSCGYLQGVISPIRR